MVDVGIKPDGGRRQLSKGGFATKREADHALRELLRLVDLGSFVEPNKIVLAAFLHEVWLPATRSTVRVGTWASYKNDLDRYVVPELGNAALQTLTPPMLTALYAKLLRVGRKDGGGLSPKSVRNVHGVLHKALGDALRWGLVLRNVADAVSPPRQQSPEMKVWSGPQLRAFLDHVRDDRLFAAWLLLATTGMRRGEAVGLRWKDVDLDKGRLRVVQTITQIRSQITIGEPKTSQGRRSIALDEATVAVLRDHRKAMLVERMLVGTDFSDEGLVFHEPDGTRLRPDAVSGRFVRRVNQHGLPRLTLHGLRHTWATLALEQGIHPRVVQERLGHSTIAITLGIYSHVTPTLHDEAAELIGGLVLGSRSP